MADGSDQALTDLIRRHLPGLPDSARLTEEMRLRAFGLDSVGAVCLLAELEAAYGLRFPDEVITPGTFQTVGTIREKLAEVTAAQAPAPEER
jgi:acyl carrier protein